MNKIIRLLNSLDEVIHDDATHAKLNTLFEDEKKTKFESVRMIQGNRYEIFLTTDGDYKKKTTAFDLLCDILCNTKKNALELKYGYTCTNEIKNHLLDYAKSMAMKDFRFSTDNQRKKFGNFTIITHW
jgi:hypothetical protein